MSEKSYREALERIADNPCGIPGHAVAVGCGSSWIAMLALDPSIAEDCSSCGGSGQRRWMEANAQIVEMNPGVNWDEQAHQYVDCGWCKGTGKQMVGKDFHS